MSIYPERGRNGFTGRWINEKRIDGRKIRTYHNSLEEAQGSSLVQPHIHEKPIVTLASLAQMIEGKLWRGHKDSLQSGQRWLLCLHLLGPATPVAEVRKVALEDLADRLRDGGRFGKRSPKTINRYLAAVSAVLRWAHEADLISGMPAIPWQKEAEGRKVYLKEADEPAFMNALRLSYGPDYEFAARVLLMTGMRVGELLSLKPEDVYNDAVHLTITKTGKPRTIPIAGGYGQSLRQWLSHHNVRYRDLLRACSDAGSRACGVCITPHALRHTTATRLVSRGVNSLTVAQIMGHSSLATTRGYTHLEVNSLRAAMQSVVQGRDRASDRMEDVCGVENAEKKGRTVPPEGICSPLRSHSATRPKDKLTNDLNDDWVVVKS